MHMDAELWGGGNTYSHGGKCEKNRENYIFFSGVP